MQPNFVVRWKNAVVLKANYKIGMAQTQNKVEKIIYSSVKRANL